MSFNSHRARFEWLCRSNELKRELSVDKCKLSGGLMEINIGSCLMLWLGSRWKHSRARIVVSGCRLYRFSTLTFSNTLGDITLNGVLEDSFISFSDERKQKLFTLQCASLVVPPTAQELPEVQSGEQVFSLLRKAENTHRRKQCRVFCIMNILH